MTPREWLATAVYVIGWSAIPLLDRRAMDTGAPQHSLTLVVFSLCALLLAVYVLIFTDSPSDAIGAASHNPYALCSAAATSAVYVAYFYVLGERGVLFVVMLQPALLAGQTVLAAAVLREPLDRWSLFGIAVMGSGMLPVQRRIPRTMGEVAGSFVNYTGSSSFGFTPRPHPTLPHHCTLIRSTYLRGWLRSRRYRWVSGTR